MKTFAVSIAALFIWTACGDGNQPIIDREALVERNSPVVTAFDSLASLSVGNGEFAYTVDITGLQTFPEIVVSDMSHASFVNITLLYIQLSVGLSLVHLGRVLADTIWRA